MTASGNIPPGENIQQVVSIVDPCGTCGRRAMVARCELKMPPRYIHTGSGQPMVAKPVSALLMCFYCGRRDELTWDDAGNRAIRNLEQGYPLPHLSKTEASWAADKNPKPVIEEPPPS